MIALVVSATARAVALVLPPSMSVRMAWMMK
jgi:hypothetical protein